MNITLPVHGPPRPLLAQYALKTNFYPSYSAANDQVDPILRIHPIYFQRVIPRYRISTSETRDLGVGPVFDAAVFMPRYPTAKPKAHLEPLPSWQGRRIDVFA
jgi:hypothetical protein